MFDGADYPKSLSEEQFEDWLKTGRESKIRYNYLLIIWDSSDEEYQSVYIENRDQISSYEMYPDAYGAEALVAVYDLYSESRIMVYD